MKNLLEKYKNLPIYWKLLIFGVSVYAAIRLYNYIIPRIGEKKAELTKKSELEVLKDNGTKPSYNDDTFKYWADKIEKACLGAGTDTETILAIFNKLKNTADFIKLDTAFGVRDFTDNLFGFLPATDMRGWLKDEKAMKPLIPTINSSLKQKGINKQI